MTGFEPMPFDFVSDSAVNCATTTAPPCVKSCNKIADFLLRGCVLKVNVLALKKWAQPNFFSSIYIIALKKKGFFAAFKSIFCDCAFSYGNERFNYPKVINEGGQ